jgi:hypothetical protein
MSPDRTPPPHNNLLHLTGRLPSCRRPPAPVAEEPRESLVLSDDEWFYESAVLSPLFMSCFMLWLTVRNLVLGDEDPAA